MPAQIMSDWVWPKVEDLVWKFFEKHLSIKRGPERVESFGLGAYSDVAKGDLHYHLKRVQGGVHVVEVAVRFPNNRIASLGSREVTIKLRKQGLQQGPIPIHPLS